MTKKILVTGGAGFLGSNMCRMLLNQGHRVIALDNLYTGYKSNILELESNPNFEFIHGSILEPMDIWADEIYNMACPASPPHYQRDPVYTWKVSTIGALNLLELAHKTGAKILQASTSEVYGDPDVHPQPESYRGNVNPHGIRACYDEGKRAAESLFMDFHRAHGVNTRIVRIFNTYGPFMDKGDGRVVSNFICQALRNEDITIYGDGKQTRSFCYVDDLIKGIIACMNADDTCVEPVNIGNPVEFTMLQLAEKVIAKIGATSKIVHLPLPADDPKQRRPDITRAKTVLNWQPVVALDDGLDKTIPWFNQVVNKSAV
jgi:UDP-glucuronate decarboxylase